MFHQRFDDFGGSVANDNDIVAVCNGQEPKVKAQKPKF